MEIKKINPLSATYAVRNNNKEKRQSKNKKEGNAQSFKEVFEKTKKEKEER